MAAPMDVTFLRDIKHGGPADQPTAVAAELAAFVDAAQSALLVAIYDFRLSDTLAAPVVAALTGAARRGVRVRIAYDAGKPSTQRVAAFAALGADPAPVGTQQWLQQQFAHTGVELKAIAAPSGKLMHNKYAVRDPGSATAAVWTGSANFTDAAWSRQENNILRIISPALAAVYERDFTQLWSTGDIIGTGAGDRGETDVNSARVDWAFAPAEGRSIDADLAGLVRAASGRVVIASMVITSHGVLAALADAVARGVPLGGIYDGGEMSPILAE
ncbi:phospholipase D-like domain-containing protein [Gandjariella thermophila]|nr:phospholipase D-like domain-containing protein [Gandjariella thermophila]